jgi:hypothetical protein
VTAMRAALIAKTPAIAKNNHHLHRRVIELRLAATAGSEKIADLLDKIMR